ncbi:MAG TPA: ATP-binding protein [Anaerolineaceae bacterium]|nr:ATP-binding protein [Anaerolineaceae bacterium]HPN52973.1 ATP-binding protein [Anaerolineaceae bacterium]
MKLRMLLAFALVILVSLLSVIFFAWQTAGNEVRAYMFQGQMIDAGALKASLETFYQQNQSWEDVDALLAPYISNGSQGRGHGQGAGGGSSRRMRVADAQGSVVGDTRMKSEGQLTEVEKGSAEQLKDADGKVIGYLLVDGGPVFQAGDEVPLINRLNTAALQAGAVAGVLGLILALVLATTLARPIQQLTRAASAMAKGDLTQRVQVKGGDELAQLGNAFNSMAEALQRAERNRRDMTADIAHELRTPLAVQRAQLEALEDGIYPLTVENLQSLQVQNRTLERLVNDLRTLAMAEAGELRLDETPGRLGNVAAKTLESFRSQAESRHILLSWNSLEEEPEVLMDPIRIEQIFNNLLSNALRHTPDDGTISMAVIRDDHGVSVTVHDSGPGISADDLPRVFERFYRGTREESSSGLGLAIARQLALAHGGRLEAANHPQGGAVFTLWLPVLSDGNGGKGT